VVFLDNVKNICWHPFKNAFITSNHNCIQYWSIVNNSTESFYVQLIWSTQSYLRANNCSIDKAIGLSHDNYKLLMQRGAMGTPVKEKKADCIVM